MYYRAVGSREGGQAAIEDHSMAEILLLFHPKSGGAITNPRPPFDGPVLIFQLPAGNFGCISQLRLNFFYHINYQILILFWCHTMMHSFKKSTCRSISIFITVCAAVRKKTEDKDVKNIYNSCKKECFFLLKCTKCLKWLQSVDWKEYLPNLLETALLPQIFVFWVSNFGYLHIFLFCLTVQSFRKIGQHLY